MTRKIDKSQIDTNKDGRIDSREWDRVRAKLDAKKEYTFEVDGRVYTGKLDAITRQLFGKGASQSGEHVSPQELVAAKIKDIKKDIDIDIKRREEALSKGDKINAEVIQKQIETKVAEAKKINKQSGQPIDLGDLDELIGGKTSKADMKAATFKPSQDRTYGKAMKEKGGSDGLGTKAAVGNGKSTFTPPADWGKAGVPFTSPEYTAGVDAMENALAALDDIGENQKRGRQLMMLFYYYARMAATGDMGAMYQFLKFITYIISKDKAKQTIDMGYKLVELQEQSREATNKLLEFQSDPNDPNSSTELLKITTKSKSETEAIATSQKLLSQMMEEFAQVVETMTNATKAALETQGRIMRAISVMR